MRTVRNVILVLAAIVFFGLGSPVFFKELEVYRFGAAQSSPSTQRTVRVDVMHG